MCCPVLYPHIVGGVGPPGLLTVSVSTVQSPTVMLSGNRSVAEVPEGGVRTIVSKSILSLQTSELVGQNVYVQGSLSVLVE